MKIALGFVTIALTLLSSGVQAQQINLVVRGQPVRAIARLADQGLGYSVLYQTPTASLRGYRVLVTCRIGEASSVTYCPTPDYISSCPRASITCR